MKRWLLILLCLAYGLACGAMSYALYLTAGLVAQWAFMPFVLAGGILFGRILVRRSQS